MLYRNIPFLRFAVIAAVASIAYSGNPPVALAQQGPTYELGFFKVGPSGLEPVTSLSVCKSSVCEELILNAHITDSSGLPAQKGLVVFQYCSYKGLPPNDITRPDEAPLEACADGSASWANLRSVHSINQSGDAFLTLASS